MISIRSDAFRTDNFKMSNPLFLQVDETLQEAYRLLDTCYREHGIKVVRISPEVSVTVIPPRPTKASMQQSGSIRSLWHRMVSTDQISVREALATARRVDDHDESGGRVVVDQSDEPDVAGCCACPNPFRWLLNRFARY